MEPLPRKRVTTVVFDAEQGSVSRRAVRVCTSSNCRTSVDERVASRLGAASVLLDPHGELARVYVIRGIAGQN
jgi:hypothetical protein